MGFFKGLSMWLDSLSNHLQSVNIKLDEYNFNIKKEQYLKDNPDNPNPTVDEVESYWIEFENMFDKKRIDEIFKKHDHKF